MGNTFLVFLMAPEAFIKDKWVPYVKIPLNLDIKALNVHKIAYFSS